MSTPAPIRDAAYSVRQIDFKKYAGLVRSLLGGAIAVVVCDVTGRRVWSLSRKAKDTFAQPLKKLNAAVPDWPTTGVAIRRCTLSQDSSAYVTSICAADKVPLGGLLVTVRHGQDDESVAYKKVSDGMHQLARLLGDEVQLIEELSRMTDELGRRYEELNLIYNTEDNVKYFDEGQDAIRHLVKNTCEYTGASFSAVIMADKTTMHAHGHRSHPLPDAARLQELIGGEVYDHMAFRKEVLVHNGGRRYREMLEDVPCKLLACPVFDENHDVIGALFLANPETAPPFTSSDRKLLQVMAHKAARIIQANYDALTGMMTRNGLEYHLETALYVVRYKQIAHTLLNINVDRLHVVNDTCGHHAGDELIRRISAKIRSQTDARDVVARLGGGEFGVLLVDRAHESAEETAERIRAAVRTLEFTWDDRRFQVSVSIGLAAMEPGTESVLSVLSAAEVACAAAKDLGRDRVQVYQTDNTMLVRRKAQIHWLGKLHSALREDRFVLYCQPIAAVDPANDHGHAEVLLRLDDEQDGILPPGVFLGSAERYNLMPAIDRWVIRNTLKTLVANLPRSVLDKRVWAINLSGQSLSDANFMQFVLDETKRAGIAPGNLCFEITETAAVANLKEAGQFIVELRKKGYKFSLDDFGSGLSSFAYLKALPVDYLKIDGAIAREVVEDAVSASMVRAIVQVGVDMGLETIAEFVETAEVQEKLASLGVHYVQGYGVGKPRPLREELVSLTSALISDGFSDTQTLSEVDEDTLGEALSLPLQSNS